MSKELIKPRKFDATGKQVFHSYHEGRKDKSGIYLKVPHEGTEGVQGYGDINQEYNSYQILRKFLCMPRVRIVKNKNGKDVLTVQKIFGEPLGDLFLKDPEKALQCSLKYINDVKKMWQDSVQPMNEGSFSINKRTK